jgi:hypothetical protein
VGRNSQAGHGSLLRKRGFSTCTDATVTHPFPAAGRRGPQDCVTSTPDSQIVVRSLALRSDCPLPTGRDLAVISVRGYVQPWVTMRLEGVGNDVIVNRTRDLPACATMNTAH